MRDCVHPPTGTGHICTLERVRAAPRPEIKAAIQSICLKSLVAPPWSGRCRPDAVGGGRERSGTRGTGLCRCTTFLETTDVLLSGVALLDIFGFQSFVSREGFEARAEQYLAALATSVGRSTRPVHYYQASDSTILTTENLGVEALRSLLKAVSAITFAALVEQGLPIRGAIAGGLYATQDAGPAGTLVAGPAVVEAYRTEQQQDWVGAMLSPGLLHLVPNLAELLTAPVRPTSHEEAHELEARMNWLLLATRHGRIPLHSTNPLTDPTLDGFVVLPKRMDTQSPEQIRIDLASFQGALTQLTPTAPDEAAQRKYTNSAVFIEQQRGRWETFSSARAWRERAEPE